MPESRHRKVNKARKRPRVPHANPSAATTHNRPAQFNFRLVAIIVVAILVVGAVTYVIVRRGQHAGEVTTASGLRIQDIKVGDGPSPQMGQTVSVNYIGWLEDGTEFNNSYKMGQPAKFKLGGVIEGWNEGLQSMKVGGKRKLFIPSKLAYGRMGKAPAIPPNANLTFEIELLGIQ